MSLMGNLYIGAGALQTGQNALNTTAHNMSNVDTAGYTRQQVQLGTRFYNTISKTNSANSYQQLGLGVNYSQVKQVRDYFLDKTYRREVGRGAYYSTSTEAIEEVENLFQELEGETFARAISNLWSSVQELAKDPSNSVNQGVFVQRCDEFITRAGAVYQGLSDYQDDLNYKVKEQVDTMNAYGNRIMELNQEILKIEAGGFEKANDLRDERNRMVDELAKMGYISCKTDVDGNILIQLEGNDFVKADSVNEICLQTDETTGFYTPYWKQYATRKPDGKLDITGAELYDMQQVISSDTNTDIGKLKSILFARGDKRATYKDLGFQTGATDEQQKEQYSKISQSIMMNTMAEFDQLVNKITTTINQVLEEAAERETATNPGSTYMRDEDGSPYKVFDTTYYETDPSTGTLTPIFTVSNVYINSKLKQAPSLLGFKKLDGKVDQTTADALKSIFTAEDYTLNPQVKTKTNFVNYYSNLVSQVANTGSVLKGISDNQQVTADNTYAAREQIVGVSSDEEMSNMIMFQNAYNASSRYINVIDQLMEHIINTLGR